MNDSPATADPREPTRYSGPPAAIRPSAAVIPWRRKPSGEVEVYWVRRGPGLRFMAGWWAFPGGGVNRSDPGVAIASVPCGIECPPPESAADDADANAKLAPNLVDGLATAAIRELFEETGVLAAAPSASSSGRPSAPSTIGDLRCGLLNREIKFPKLIDQLEVRPDASRLVFAGRWTTPAFSSIRFDNRFFLFEWDARRDSEPSIIEGELDRGEWITPGEALKRWSRGEALLAAPIVHILRVLADEGPEDGIERLRHPSARELTPAHRFVFLPGLVMLPFRTRTLPPATHTNAFLLGANRTILVDPGSDFPEEISALLSLLEESAQEGKPIEQIWLTHHHRDHVGAVNSVRDHFHVPVLAHAATAERLSSEGIRVDGELADGQRIELPGDPSTLVGVLHTPGHARGHLCFHVEALNALIAGDMVSGVSTIVIDPPEGDMGDYLDSLARLEALNPTTLFPSHGSATPYATSMLRAVRVHRLQREEAVLAAWKSGTRDSEHLLDQVYGEIESALRPTAERQIQAHLEHLRSRERI